MNAEDHILHDLDTRCWRALHHTQHRDTCIQQITLELAQHIGKMRGENGDPRGYHGDQAARLTRWLLVLTRPCAAGHVRSGMDIEQALALVDSQAWRDQRLVALPELPRELQQAAEAA